ncbi:MAG: hypothetical protein R3C15_02560 [Thermoleophilia bacterium]
MLHRGPPEDRLRVPGKRDLTDGGAVSQSDDPGDGRACLVGRDAELVEHAGCDALLLAQEPEEQVLAAEVVVLQRACLVLCEDDYLAHVR